MQARYPLFRPFLSFVLGIFSASLWHPGLTVSILIVLGFGLLGIFTGFSRVIFSSPRRRWYFGLCLTLFYISLGFAFQSIQSEQWKSTPDSLSEVGDTYLQFRLLDDPAEKKKTQAAVGRLMAIYKGAVRSSKGEKVMLYFEKSESLKSLVAGDVLLIKAKLRLPDPATNPAQFDYTSFLGRRAIYHQAYVKEEDWKILRAERGGFKQRLGRLRTLLLSKISSWRLKPEEEAVTMALLLGARDKMSEELLKSYSAAGTAHVLAVSGLHVGMLYLLFSGLLSFLKKKGNGPLFRCILLLTMLWVYALLTGLSASVVRAVTMFSFITLGSCFSRQTSIYNTVLSSALFLLIINPQYLHDVGFQFSYSALLGIVWLQPKLKALWKPRYKVLNFFWDVITVSLAAQVTSFPLAIYYFHQFPMLFLLANCFVIPLISLLLYFGLTVLIISLITSPPQLILKLYASCVQIMNNGVALIEQQKSFLLDAIHISQLEVTLLYSIVLFLGFWLFHGGYRRLLLGLSVLLTFVCFQWLEDRRFGQQHFLTVYEVRGHASFGVYHGYKGVLLADKALLADSAGLDFNIHPHWSQRDITERHLISLESNYRNDWFLKKTSFVGIDELVVCLPEEMNQFKAPCSLWIINRKSPPPPRQPLDGLIVLSSDLRDRIRKQWHHWAVEKEVEIWDVQQRGACTIDLKSRDATLSCVAARQPQF